MSWLTYTRFINSRLFLVAIALAIPACGKWAQEKGDCFDGCETKDRDRDREVIAGPQGPAGRDGARGERGPAGDQGLSGNAGERGEKGDKGEDGAPGENGADGSLPTAEITTFGFISGVSNFDIYWSGTITAPTRFLISALTSTSNPQGGWIDIRVADEVFCYQRENKSKWYSLVYKKEEGAVLGCDSNSEKEPNAFSLSVVVEDGDELEIIPRDSKLNSVVWSIDLLTWRIEE